MKVRVWGVELGMTDNDVIRRHGQPTSVLTLNKSATCLVYSDSGSKDGPRRGIHTVVHVGSDSVVYACTGEVCSVGLLEFSVGNDVRLITSIMDPDSGSSTDDNIVFITDDGLFSVKVNDNLKCESFTVSVCSCGDLPDYYRRLA